jgi:hypothetical protein
MVKHAVKSGLEAKAASWAMMKEKGVSAPSNSPIKGGKVFDTNAKWFTGC